MGFVRPPASAVELRSWWPWPAIDFLLEGKAGGLLARVGDAARFGVYSARELGDRNGIALGSAWNARWLKRGTGERGAAGRRIDSVPAGGGQLWAGCRPWRLRVRSREGAGRFCARRETRLFPNWAQCRQVKKYLEEKGAGGGEEEEDEEGDLEEEVEDNDGDPKARWGGRDGRRANAPRG
eukprot:evm.model.scf_1173.3 EVM.evm.TU.scf_1173.3   scf_1173:8528-9070(-)